MIDKETVLILGAGSSNEVGFPLGKTLIKNILDLAAGETIGLHLRSPKDIVNHSLRNSHLLWRLLDISGEKKEDNGSYSVDDIQKFAADLEDANPPSIDDFLLSPTKYSLIGKLFILFALSECEDIRRFQGNKNFGLKWGWYRYLWERLIDDTGKDFKKLKNNRLKIITFNYDRSLEIFLFKAIKAQYNLHDYENKIASFFDEISIQHVHGKLGIMSWQFNYQQAHRKQPKVINDFTPVTFRDLFPLYDKVGTFGASEADFGVSQFINDQSRSTFAKEIIERAKMIRISHELPLEKEDYREIFQKAKRVYFLGFAYHEQNIQALGLDKGNYGTPLSHDIEIHGTAVGKTKKQIDDIKSYIASFSRPPEKINIKNKWDGIDDKESSKITSFLRDVDF
ncbi:MAG: hypothetical protein WCY09_01795 [Candidatus Omnitrophota bacterium]